jgi:hypothetical protein
MYGIVGLNQPRPFWYCILSHPRIASALSGWLLLSHFIMLVNICSLPWITNPNIFNRSSCQIPVLSEQLFGKSAFLFLVLVLIPVSLASHTRVSQCLDETYM